METVLLIGLILVLWPFTFVFGRSIPTRVRLFLILFLALVSGARFIQLARTGDQIVAECIFAALTIVFIISAMRQWRRRAAHN
jgi:hypothetical protein